MIGNLFLMKFENWIRWKFVGFKLFRIGKSVVWETLPKLKSSDNQNNNKPGIKAFTYLYSGCMIHKFSMNKYLVRNTWVETIFFYEFNIPSLISENIEWKKW